VCVLRIELQVDLCSTSIEYFRSNICALLLLIGTSSGFQELGVMRCSWIHGWFPLGCGREGGENDGEAVATVQG
jgi:hypothetical protein